MRRVTRTLTWHSPVYYLLILASILIYLIVALVVRETVKVELGICDDHHSSWIRNIWITMLIIVGALLSFVGAIAFEEVMLALLGAILLLGGAIFGITSRLVLPAKIDKQFVWLTKVNKDYLDSLPHWTGH
jgi:hypothetical protein